MCLSPAEVARTLARGRLPGVLRIAEHPDPFAVHHATDGSGRPLLLFRDDADVAELAAGRQPVTLTVRDRPPVPGAPRRGRVLLTGRARKLDPETAAEQAITFAEANPVGDLLDVGRGAELYVIDVDEVQLHGRPGPTGSAAIDPAAYVAAEPDPLHEYERELLLDLADHHVPQITAYFRQLLDRAGVPHGPLLRPVRLDRYGFLVDSGQRPDGLEGARRLVRLNFAHPVHCRHELAQLLRPVLFQPDGEYEG